MRITATPADLFELALRQRGEAAQNRAMVKVIKADLAEAFLDANPKEKPKESADD